MVSLDLVLDVRLCYFLKSKLLCELGQGEGLSWELAERAWLWALGAGLRAVRLGFAMCRLDTNSPGAGFCVYYM